MTATPSRFAIASSPARVCCASKPARWAAVNCGCGNSSAPPCSARHSLPARQPFLVLAAAAIVLLLPSLVLGTLISHSSPQNLTWAAQFAEQVRAGVLYPRWMPDSFEGLGSPAFYFYPPLPFWADALVSIVTANVMPVPYRLAVTSTLILFASGLAMHAWLQQQTESAPAALWGALAYMAIFPGMVAFACFNLGVLIVGIGRAQLDPFDKPTYLQRGAKIDAGLAHVDRNSLIVRTGTGGNAVAVVNDLYALLNDQAGEDFWITFVGVCKPIPISIKLDNAAGFYKQYVD